MFKYCLWYRILKNNTLYSTVSKYSELFNTPNFIPHITFKHGMDKRTAIMEYHRLKTPNADYTFKPYGRPYQTSSNGFHAVQQDLCAEGQNSYHISLAYNTRRKFTNEEIDMVEPLDFNIHPRHYSFELWDCHDPSPSMWSRVS